MRHAFCMRVEVSAQVLDEGEELRPFEPCEERETTSLMHPYVYILAQGVHQNLWISSTKFLYVSGDLYTFGPFPEKVVVFQVSGTIYDA